MAGNADEITLSREFVDAVELRASHYSRGTEHERFDKLDFQPSASLSPPGAPIFRHPHHALNVACQPITCCPSEMSIAPPNGSWPSITITSPLVALACIGALFLAQAETRGGRSGVLAAAMIAPVTCARNGC